MLINLLIEDLDLLTSKIFFMKLLYPNNNHHVFSDD